jgi:2-polyprenyl-6-methoxyphenol hydroxylase-like FAD-dependent oxidoreductase
MIALTPPADIRRAYDAIVVGARCAGAATALLLAREGLRVLVVDRGAYGADTLSTHALMRGGVVQLARWGVLDAVAEAGTPAVRRTTFHYADEPLEIPIKPRDGVDALYAPRRTVLDPILVDAARRAGADVAFGVRLAGLTRSSDGRVRGAVLEERAGRARRVDAAIVIGADGQRSTVARETGAEVYAAGRHATALVYAHWQGLDADGYNWYFRPGVSAGVIPTNGGACCVFAAVPPERFQAEIRRDLEAGYGRVLRECSSELGAAVEGARRAGRLWTFPGQAGCFRRSHGPGWALVGDAGYFKDPLTAHGITDALRDAELLARAVATGTDAALGEYEATRDWAARDVFEATDAVASFAWDLAEVQAHHQALSKAMAREARWLAGLDRDAAATVA